MTFTISEDYGRIREILTDAQCYGRMKGDHNPPIERFSVGPTPGVQFIIADDGRFIAGVFLLCDTEVVGVNEVHFCIMPEWWGFSTQIGLKFLEWVWANTSLTTLRGKVPTYNMLAWHVASSVGFEITGRLEDSVRKEGKMYATILSEIARPVQNVRSATA